ncbi:MAG: hypothetical protein H8E29_00250 [Anaerolineales bacterium]|uniref:Uncharacterized protein n=1 Tax=Candidatus Desulfolinea nitratireducens TaxID=2841698 RepID=A0A8J6THJ8_9CHLR|nr:hypothetical protein [Candidatus Desulfolinea nitratireducens]
MKRSPVWLSYSLVIVEILMGCTLVDIGSTPTATVPIDGMKQVESIERAKPGEISYTEIHSPENGKIAVRIDVPQQPRYGESAPIIVVASTWFVEKYNSAATPFHLEFNPVSTGAMVITHLWPGKTDPDSGMRSEGVYDFGGPDSLAALRDTIQFALGKIADVKGKTLADLITIKPLYENVGMFASSHAGVVATNVMAYYGETFPELKYFVGRENPTMAEMYPLEIGHFNQNLRPIYNLYYDPDGYTPTSIAVDYTHLSWVQNNSYPEGRPIFLVPGKQDYVLDDKGPNINGKRWFSHPLTQALWDNGVFSAQSWPEDVATPEETAAFWPYRETIRNYALIGEKLPELRVMLVFAAFDHVQTAPDKPHIRQAYDGFHKNAGLWTRLNCDLAYIQAEVHPSASAENGFGGHPANTEPRNWEAEAMSWGFEGRLAGELTAKSVPIACAAEMADRVQTNNWQPNLDGVLFTR